mmetsp:Transcript_26234/g.51343  ORF Transcript_26234/g.51343 Transcript_26234/m.51343 type:complete len:247 (-) Transcript_26234:352-1092(-)|eukprot:CAMPEP_0167789520 /NCGR_PEP_ID=MMETSP0111_2-20121227/10738_1 /TAXON_ID=91324 /ORGANISM="Lotharella globosa, Strain CCCM811" /LENGTH=246 /DNA_ID=CAMNT_0007681711 /DNA_START=128 /DNA_END=868 /DNA_ORIENTATION=+
MLKEHHEFVHLSAGDLLRAERKSGSANADLINSYIKEGKIVPVKITVGLIKKAMDDAKKQGKIYFLIDGFPRNQDNVEGWEEVVGDAADVRGVLYFMCEDDNILVERIVERGKTSGRLDDNKEAITKRLKTYYESTKPIIDMYEKKNLVLALDAAKSKTEVYQLVKSRLSLPMADLTFEEEATILKIWDELKLKPNQSASVDELCEKIGVDAKDISGESTVTLAKFASYAQANKEKVFKEAESKST